MTDDEMDALFEECVGHMCDDNPEMGAESLVELAHIWARAGLTKQSFLDFRHHLITTAIERLGTHATAFIHNKVQLAEQGLRKERNKSANSSIIIH